MGGPAPAQPNPLEYSLIPSILDPGNGSQGDHSSRASQTARQRDGNLRSFFSRRFPPLQVLPCSRTDNCSAIAVLAVLASIPNPFQSRTLIRHTPLILDDVGYHLNLRAGNLLQRRSTRPVSLHRALPSNALAILFRLDNTAPRFLLLQPTWQTRPSVSSRAAQFTSAL